MFDLSGNQLFSVHGGGDGDGLAGALGGFLSAIEGLASLPPGEIFPALLPGIAAMDNIHPLFVHFPIAFLTAFFVIDLIAGILRKPDWRYAASWFLYLGTIFAGMAMLAGFHAASTVPHGEDVHEIMETHEHLGVTIFSLAVVLSVWRLIGKPRQGVSNYLYLFFAGFLSVLLVFAADLGGLMVYKHGVAVLAVRSLGHVESFEEHRHEHSHLH